MKLAEKMQKILPAGTQAIRNKGAIFVRWRGRTHKIELEEKRGRGKKAAGLELVAPFPCKIVKIFIADGQMVAAGDPVLSVEAMKMEHTYTSPKAGRIAKVRVKPGEIVAEGTSFVEWGKDG